MYASSESEKKGRSALKSTLERFLSPSANKLLIFDYLNSIKGFRYEAWCRAREMQTTHATVYVDTPVETCRAWNEARPEAERYSPAVFLDLCQRMEAPNAEKRWDAPLFTATYDPAADAAAAASSAAAPAAAADSASSASSSPSSTPTSTGKLSPALLDSLTAVLLKGKVAPANISVIPARMESSNYLFELDRITSEIVKTIVEKQSGSDASDGGASCQIGDSIAIAGVKAPIVLLRRIHLPELRRLQTQYLKMARLRTPDSTAGIAASFVEHVNVGIKTQGSMGMASRAAAAGLGASSSSGGAQ